MSDFFYSIIAICVLIVGLCCALARSVKMINKLLCFMWGGHDYFVKPELVKLNIQEKPCWTVSYFCKHCGEIKNGS